MFPYTFDMLDIEDLMLQDLLHFSGITINFQTDALNPYSHWLI